MTATLEMINEQPAVSLVPGENAIKSEPKPFPCRVAVDLIPAKGWLKDQIVNANEPGIERDRLLRLKHLIPLPGNIVHEFEPDTKELIAEIADLQEQIEALQEEKEGFPRLLKDLEAKHAAAIKALKDENAGCYDVMKKQEEEIVSLKIAALPKNQDNPNAPESPAPKQEPAKKK